MANHPNRGARTAASNPRPAEIRAAREALRLSPEAAGAVLYSSGRWWQRCESGEARMHPALWELFNWKTYGRPPP